MNIQKLNKLNAISVTLIFLLTIFTPLLISIVEKDLKVSKAERRKLSSLPSFEMKTGAIKRLPEQLDNYFSDHFGGREWLSSTYRKIKFAIGDSPAEDVTLGKDGWLFLGSIKKGYSRYNDPIGDVRNVNLHSESDLQNIAAHMTTVKRWLDEQGIEYLFVLIPNKHTVYADKLPDYIQKINTQSSSDQLVDYLRKHTNINVVDLRQPLLNAKSEHPLYKRTGTHWNHYAVNIAQYEIMQTVQKLYPDAVNPRLFPLKDGVNKSGGDLATMIGNRNFQEAAPRPIFKNTCRPVKVPRDAKETEIFSVTCSEGKLTSLIFRDSFFNDMKQYFSRQFKHTTYVWGKLDFATLKQQLQRHKTHIVIEEIVERKLPYIPDPIAESQIIAEEIGQTKTIETDNLN